MNWEYDETDEVQFTDWRVFNDTEGRYRYIRVENENGTSLFNPLVPWVPAAFLERIKRKGRATIIIKNITFEYSALFRCTLSGKTGVASIDDTISLVVTGMCTCFYLQELKSYTCQSQTVFFFCLVVTGPHFLARKFFKELNNNIYT